MAKNKSAHYHDVIVVHDVDLHDQERQQQLQQQQHQHDKTKEGIILLFLSAFLFSFMGMFLQFTGRMGIPSTELVFIRSVFQGTFVLLGMVIFRVDDSPKASESDNDGIRVEVDNVETTGNNDNNLDVEGVGMVLLSEELSNEEKKLEKESGYYTRIISPTTTYPHEEASLLATSPKCTYSSTLLSTTKHQPASSFKPSPTIVLLPPRIIQRPFGTTPTMCKIVILRGIIGGFGFINYYYTLSTLPLGDATTLLSLYPIVTIFLARIVLGEEIKPLYIVAALFSVVGAALISRPSFLFGNEDDDDDDARPPKLGYITAIIGSLCASAVIVLIRKAGKVGAHTLQLLFSWTVFGVSFSLIVGFIAGSTEADQQWRIPSRQEMPSVLGVCVSGTFAHFLLNYAAKLVPATMAGLLRSSDIFWAYLLEMIVLSQHPPKETLCGVLLVCSSLVLVLLASNEKTSNMMKRLGSVGNLTAAK
mmetsp:Transcript_41367/g.74575  ORF Transcript_41367/g.74575 Transcript_41367/m.74575 type:complete len:476 (-) Transcript_41367:55-1482(-)